MEEKLVFLNNDLMFSLVCYYVLKCDVSNGRNQHVGKRFGIKLSVDEQSRLKL